MHTYNLFLALLISIADLSAALPTPHRQPSTGKNISRVITARGLCPPLTWLPIDSDEDTGEELGLEIVLDESKSTSLWCTYTVPDKWDGKPAYVRTPTPGLGDQEMATHIQSLELGRRLGKVLAETEIDGLPAAVIDATPFSGKRIYETSRWIKNFARSNRKPPSWDAYARCTRVIDSAHNAVRDKMIWYMEQEGLVYPMDEFTYQSSVLFNDDWSAVELIGWDPSSIRYAPHTHVATTLDKTSLFGQISNRDLSAAENSLDKGRVSHDFRGWCEYSNPTPPPNLIHTYDGSDGA